MTDNEDLALQISDYVSREKRDLDELDWTWENLAARLGKHRNTITKWKKEGLPQYARAYVNLALRMKRLKEEMEP